MLLTADVINALPLDRIRIIKAFLSSCLLACVIFLVIRAIGKHADRDVKNDPPSAIQDEPSQESEMTEEPAIDED